jgi:hypothetical protein
VKISIGKSNIRFIWDYVHPSGVLAVRAQGIGGVAETFVSEATA